MNVSAPARGERRTAAPGRQGVRAVALLGLLARPARPARPALLGRLGRRGWPALVALLALLALTSLAASGGAARAAVLHVDAVGGDDAADGRTWGTALASLPQALALAAQEPDQRTVTVRVASGTYAAADLVVDRPMVLVGAYAPGGASRDRAAFESVLDAGGAAGVLDFATGAGGSILDGFTLRGAASVALRVHAGVTVRNLRVEDVAGVGALLLGGSIEESTFARCALGGLQLLAPACERPAVRARHLLVEDCGRVGIGAQDGGCGLDGPPVVVVAHVRIRRTMDSAGLALDCCPEISDAAVTDTQGDGIVLNAPFSEPPPVVTPSPLLEHVTVTGSTGAAVRVNGVDGAALRRSILWGNAGGDIAPAGAPSDAEHVLSEALLPGTGNLGGVDPLLVAGPSGATYLSQVAAGQAADSPAVDAGGVPAAGLAAGLRTTRTDGVRDAGPVDLGFHHEATSFTLSRGTEPDALVPLLTDVSLPVVDAGAVGAAPLLFYRVDADRDVLVRREGSDIVVLFDYQRFDQP